MLSLIEMMLSPVAEEVDCVIYHYSIHSGQFDCVTKVMKKAGRGDEAVPIQGNRSHIVINIFECNRSK
jgi:hypothetical protein